MTEVQFIKTGGEELVVLSRRDYDALLACAGDPSAEDAMGARLLAEHGGEAALPAPVMDRILDGESPILVVMQHRGLTQAELSRRSGLSQPFISKLIRAEVKARPRSVEALARGLAVSADVLSMG